MQLSTYRMFKNQEGFISLNDVQLKKYQMIIAKITEDIVNTCEELEINVMLAYGSALGAVRHSGFIPWDDDMDLFMFRADYERFLPFFKEKYQEKYWVHTPEKTKNYGALLPKVLLKGTVVRQFEDYKNDECGAFVDIFILENTFDNLILKKIHGIGCFIFAGMISCRRMYRDKQFLLSIVEDEELTAAIRKKAFLGGIVRFIPFDVLTKIAYRWYKLCKNNSSKEVIIPSGSPQKRFYARRWFLGIRKHKFENYDWSIPKEAEKFLSDMYGDFMKIPSEEKREKHTFLEFKI